MTTQIGKRSDQKRLKKTGYLASCQNYTYRCLQEEQEVCHQEGNLFLHLDDKLQSTKRGKLCLQLQLATAFPTFNRQPLVLMLEEPVKVVEMVAFPLSMESSEVPESLLRAELHLDIKG